MVTESRVSKAFSRATSRALQPPNTSWTLTLCRPPDPPSPTTRSIRVFRDRLLILCTYLLIYLVCWTARTSATLGKKYLPIDVLANLFLVYQGLFDSLVISDLCKCSTFTSAFCCCGYYPYRQSTPAERQIQDSRVRVGRSAPLSTFSRFTKWSLVVPDPMVHPPSPTASASYPITPLPRGGRHGLGREMEDFEHKWGEGSLVSTRTLAARRKVEYEGGRDTSLTSRTGCFG